MNKERPQTSVKPFKGVSLINANKTRPITSHSKTNLINNKENKIIEEKFKVENEVKTNHKIRPFTSVNTKKTVKNVTSKPSEQLYSLPELSNTFRADFKKRNIKTAKPNFNESNYKAKFINGNKDDLDLVYLIMKYSPKKYDLDKLNEKFKIVNKHFNHKLTNKENMSKLDSTYYKYNILYGSNSSNLIRSYSPKMRPGSGEVRNALTHKVDVDHWDRKCLTEDEVALLFSAKCSDIGIDSDKQHLEAKFIDYCDKKCINRVIDFKESNFGIACCEILSNILSKSDKVARLILSRNNIGDLGIIKLMDGVKKNKSVVLLDISSCNLTYRGGNIVFSSLLENESIISLNISSKEGLNRNRLTPEGLEEIEKLLNVNKYLEFLNLSGTNIKNKGLKYILNGLNKNKILHTLNISNNEIDHIGMQSFSKILNQPNKLTYLNLDENPLGNQGIEALALCLNKPYFSSLKTLEISKCKFDFNGFKKLFEYLQGNKRLETLKCNHNYLKTVDDEFESIKPAFSNLNLKILHLGYCKLGNRAARVLAEGLMVNQTINTLIIPDNNIDDKGFTYFVDVPERNVALSNLDISKNQISDFSANPFVKKLQFNKTLKNINFYDNEIRNETGSSLIEILRLNPNLHRINLKFNAIQSKTLDEIGRQLKANRDIINFKKIPNLRKEIRSNYINDQDFENIDLKIKESAVTYQNLVEKLKEESEKYSLQKQEEEQRIIIQNGENSGVFEQLCKAEEENKVIKREILNITNDFEREIALKTNIIDEANANIEEINEKIKDFKKMYDKKKVIWKDDLMKIQKESKAIIDRLNAGQMSYNSMLKDLESKELLIDKGENPEKYIVKEVLEEGPMQRKNSIIMNSGKKQSTLSVNKSNSIGKDLNAKLKSGSSKVIDGKTKNNTTKNSKSKDKDKKTKNKNNDKVIEKSGFSKGNQEVSNFKLDNDNNENKELLDKDKNIEKEKNNSNNIKTVKSKIDTKPTAELKPREKYKIGKPNI